MEKSWNEYVVLHSSLKEHKKQATKFDGDHFRSLLKGCMSQGHIYIIANWGIC